jgi:phytoene/squalene synthetase
MEMDLEKKEYDADEYSKYISGSAEAVGLMCLCVFSEKNTPIIQYAETLCHETGRGFSKVNFLRDAKSDNMNWDEFIFRRWI